jgi:hypothetical protein
MEIFKNFKIKNAQQYCWAFLILKFLNRKPCILPRGRLRSGARMGCSRWSRLAEGPDLALWDIFLWTETKMLDRRQG